MRSLQILVAVAVAAMVAAMAFGAYEIARPGCSPLPVAVPTDDPNSGAAATVDSAVVCAVLGRPMPQVTALPPGVHEGGIFYSAPPGVARGFLVTVTYTQGQRGVAELVILRGDAIPIGNQGEVNGSVQGQPAIVTQPYSVPPGLPAVMSYMWSRDGLLYVLHVRIDDGIDRAAADAMAESVR